MAGQAGWYRAPGEAGQLRYWNGAAWTNHRQPDPALAAPAPAPEPASAIDDTDPMAHFERQFASASFLAASESDHAGTDIVRSAPQPQYRPRAAVTPSTSLASPAPELVSNAAASTSSLGPIALGPGGTAATVPDAPVSEFDRFFDEMSALAEMPALAPVPRAVPSSAAPSASTSTEVVRSHRAEPAEETAAAPTKPVAVGIAPTRKAAMGAARIMAAGIILVLLGVLAMAFFSLTGSVSAGEVKTNAIVTSLGATTANSCTPVATFAVTGRSYTAKSSAALTPCPIGLGQSVDVIYSATNPASAARIEIGVSVVPYLWIVPIIGGLVFVGGLITFIVRAGSIVSGVRLLREPKVAEAPAGSRTEAA